MDDAAGPSVRTYRVFRVSSAGRVVSVPDTFDAATEAEAIRQARFLAKGHAVELWDGARLVWQSGAPEER